LTGKRKGFPAKQKVDGKKKRLTGKRKDFSEKQKVIGKKKRFFRKRNKKMDYNIFYKLHFL
jgi:hypothetical protein